MEYFKDSNNKLNYNLFEEIFISILLSLNIGFSIKRTLNIISGLLKISKTKKVIDELKKQKVIIKGNSVNEIVDGSDLENLDNNELFPLLKYDSINNRNDRNDNSTDTNNIPITNNVNKSISKVNILSKPIFRKTKSILSDLYRWKIF